MSFYAFALVMVGLFITAFLLDRGVPAESAIVPFLLTVAFAPSL